jgi:hypothetical protein
MDIVNEITKKKVDSSKINTVRVFTSGIVTGTVLFVVSGILNGVILGNNIKNWMIEMGGLIHPLDQINSFILWIVMSLMQGIAAMWFYAGFYKIYGAGLRIVLFAGLLVWIISKLAVALDLIALGLLPKVIIVGQLAGSLVSVLAGIYLGSLIYKEKKTV